MCPVEKVVSCEISFIPILSHDYRDDVNKVLDIIRSYDLEHSVGLLSTTVRGDRGRIFSLIMEIYDKMDGICHFTMDIRISNTCGC